MGTDWGSTIILCGSFFLKTDRNLVFFLTADADPLFFNAVLDPSLSNLNAKNKHLIFSLLPVLTGTGTGYLNFTASITNIEPRLRAGGI